MHDILDRVNVCVYLSIQFRTSPLVGDLHSHQFTQEPMSRSMQQIFLSRRLRRPIEHFVHNFAFYMINIKIAPFFFFNIFIFSSVRCPH